jgi:hypothetical protein
MSLVLISLIGRLEKSGFKIGEACQPLEIIVDFRKTITVVLGRMPIRIFPDLLENCKLVKKAPTKEETAKFPSHLDMLNGLEFWRPLTPFYNP